MFNVDLIAGTRPNFVKVASLIAAQRSFPKLGNKFNFRIVHTGQHYDARLSKIFFEQLALPSPNVNFGVGSGSQATQTAGIMCHYEDWLSTSSCDLAVVVGDVNSTVACALTAAKMNVLLAHVEAGIRSGDKSMPEEINRIATDSITDLFFTTSRSAADFLISCGHAEDQVFFVGNTMIDTLKNNEAKFARPKDLNSNVAPKGRYLLLTMHRPSNVDKKSQFLENLHIISDLACGLDIIFPVHPRNKDIWNNSVGLPNNIKVIEPQPYLEFCWLLKNCKAVITVSGGVTEEATYLGIPCLTLRESTERPETVDVGTNVLVGTDPRDLEVYLKQIFNGQFKNGSVPDLWDGQTGRRIPRILTEILPNKCSD